MFSWGAAQAAPLIASLKPYPGDDLQARRQSQVCRKYFEIAHNGQDTNPIHMDQVQVYKNGAIWWASITGPTLTRPTNFT